MHAATWAMLGQDGTNDHRWRELCQLIMTEKDPQKLLTLVRELNQEFERREKQLRSPESPAGDK
jgi:hypothetical protein